MFKTLVNDYRQVFERRHLEHSYDQQVMAGYGGDGHQTF